MERHQIAREIWLHIQLNHPSIIALYAAWKDRDYIYLVLEWAPEVGERATEVAALDLGEPKRSALVPRCSPTHSLIHALIPTSSHPQGNVFTFLQQHGGRLPEHVAVPMVLEPTMSALAYIHGLGMIHRDVKPENILLTTSMQIKLADFGLSIHSNYEVANTRLGTIDYLSPEILDCPVKQHPADHKTNPNKWYTNKVDCWSVGVLAYELLAGHTPFEAVSCVGCCCCWWWWRRWWWRLVGAWVNSKMGWLCALFAAALQPTDHHRHPPAPRHPRSAPPRRPSTRSSPRRCPTHPTCHQVPWTL